MSKRNDGALYTGQTSASKRLREERVERLRNREIDRTKVEPLEGLLKELVQQEKDGITKRVWSFIHLDDSEENVKSALLALKLYEDMIDSFGKRLDVLLLKRRLPEESQDGQQ